MKITWKSLAGLLAAAAGAAAASAGALPPSVGGPLSVAGLAVLALERLADARDFATTTNAPSLPPALAAATTDAISSAQAEAAKLRADLAQWVSYARQLEGRVTQGGPIAPPSVPNTPPAPAAPPAPPAP